MMEYSGWTYLIKIISENIYFVLLPDLKTIKMHLLD